ncbi:MAG: class II glutamine amidotransferase [candidate division WOR-3 bacterium]
MCRLFGLMANKEVDVKFSMLEAENKFKVQAGYNPDGWGVGYYDRENNPRIEKYGKCALKDERFDKFVKEIKSKIFIAHVRLASSGSRSSDKNAHPFQYKNWLFAHNGTINKERIRKLLAEPYNQNFTSEPIDSEVYFRFIIQNIEKNIEAIEGILAAVKMVMQDAAGANFLLSNGEELYAFKYGRPLYFLERKPSAPLHYISKETHALIESKRLAGEKAVLIATEKITERENWREFKDGDLLIVNKNLELKLERLL